MEANKMERGSQALKSHMTNCPQMEIRQTRKGWFQECLSCEARSEFKYFIGADQVFHSLEDADCICRLCCAPIHPFQTVVKELNTDAEIITVDRPFRCAMSNCKCCCYQEATFASGGAELGSIRETCWFCVPSFKIVDDKGNPMFLVHPPTCCGGMCVNCCAEGNPCGAGCCKQSFRFYSPDQTNTDGDAPYVGHILKKPKSLSTELFTDAQAFEVHFPEGAKADVKGIFMGSAIFINTNFYESSE